MISNSMKLISGIFPPASDTARLQPRGDYVVLGVKTWKILINDSCHISFTNHEHLRFYVDWELPSWFDGTSKQIHGTSEMIRGTSKFDPWEI